jgi:hypothetical protein
VIQKNTNSREKITRIPPIRFVVKNTCIYINRQYERKENHTRVEIKTKENTRERANTQICVTKPALK